MKLVFIVESENVVQDTQSFYFQRGNPECMHEVQFSETVSYSCNQKA
jgi:hypothetical protein